MKYIVGIGEGSQLFIGFFCTLSKKHKRKLKQGGTT